MRTGIAAGARRVLAIGLLSGVGVLPGCSARRLDLSTVPVSFSVGESERFGGGAVSVDSAGDFVRFAVAGPAEVALVSITADGRVHPLYPQLPGESSRVAGGSYAVAVAVPWWWGVPASVQATWAAPTAAEVTRANVSCNYAARVTFARTMSSSASTGGAGTGSTRTGPGQANDVSLSGGIGMVGAGASNSASCGAAPLGGGSAAAPSADARWEDREDVILLVVSDTAVSPTVLRARVTHLRIASLAELSALPQRIVGDPSRPFAGYFATRARTSSDPRQATTP